MLTAPKEACAADLISAQLGFSWITFMFGLALLLPPTQKVPYVLFDTFRHYMPLWGWGVCGIAVSVLHVVGYIKRHRWLLVVALNLSAGFWFFVAFCSLISAWYLPTAWSCTPHVVIFLRSSYRVPYWTKPHQPKQ